MQDDGKKCQEQTVLDGHGVCLGRACSLRAFIVFAGSIGIEVCPFRAIDACLIGPRITLHGTAVNAVVCPRTRAELTATTWLWLRCGRFLQITLACRNVCASGSRAATPREQSCVSTSRAAGGLVYPESIPANCALSHATQLFLLCSVGVLTGVRLLPADMQAEQRHHQQQQSRSLTRSWQESTSCACDRCVWRCRQMTSVPTCHSVRRNCQVEERWDLASVQEL